jgi:hypothetical protein
MKYRRDHHRSHQFSSLRLPKHRSIYNAFTHIAAVIIAYRINSSQHKPIRVFLPD